MNREQLIQARAYALWEAEGCPHGREEQHWRQAAIEVDEAVTEALAQASPPADATPKPAIAPKPAAKRPRTKAKPDESVAKPRARGKAKT
jgi:hypothetical protein